MQMETQRRELIEKIRDLPMRLRERVSGLTDTQLTTHFLASEWTVAQNVHHLADSHMNSFIRTRLILTEERPPLKPYDQDRWAELADSGTTALEESLSILEGLHQRWVRLFESLGEADWLRAGLHPEIGEVTVDDILRIYAAHGEGHLDQIERTLAARNSKQ
ncbi:MAG TPA: putative metal-dependent hydrolase [Roseiflexaceae bacterium]|nr:putative metal-dependent hydrolase [Roseiflexaceae bacterium]